MSDNVALRLFAKERIPATISFVTHAPVIDMTGILNQLSSGSGSHPSNHTPTLLVISVCTSLIGSSSVSNLSGTTANQSMDHLRHSLLLQQELLLMPCALWGPHAPARAMVDFESNTYPLPCPRRRTSSQRIAHRKFCALHLREEVSNAAAPTLRRISIERCEGWALESLSSPRHTERRRGQPSRSEHTNLRTQISQYRPYTCIIETSTKSESLLV